MDAILSYVAFVAIVMAENVRAQRYYDLATLLADIEVNGLKTPLLVHKDGKTYTVIQGHRRFTCLAKLHESNPARFKELFPNGVSCIVKKGLTPLEIARLKVDHGNELALRDPFELQKCASMLFNAGDGEKEVVIELAGLMDRISPMKPERRKEIEALPTKADRDKATFEYRRGLVQGLHNAHRCPLIVMAALECKCEGMAPVDFENEYLPKLTVGHITRLWKAHSDDLKIEDEKGVKVFSKRRPGPKFKDTWVKIAESAQKAAEDKENGEVREKAMSGKDMKVEITEGKWLSAFGQKLTKHHTGDKSVGELTEYDYTCYCGELVKEADPKLWKQVVKAAKAAEVKAVEVEPVEVSAEK